MKKIYTPFLFISLLGIFILFTGYAAGPASVLSLSFTGAPGENGLLCSNCHGFPGAYGGVNTIVEVFEPGNSTPVTSYTSGTIYDVQVTVNYNINTPIGYGFQCVAVDAQGDQIGNFSNPQANTKLVSLPSGVQVAEQNGISVLGQAHIFKWQWMAPAFLQSVDVTFYSTGVAVNSNSANTGDSGSAVSGTVTLPPAPLPVELIDFTVSNVDNHYHLLEWSTASELNADYFIIEHSLDGESFSPIAKQTAAGTTYERQDYDFRLTEPKPGTNYYRLTQVDFDGQSQTFNTVSVYQFEALELVKLYPIPVTTTANLEIQYAEADFFNLEVHDQSGKTVKQQAVELKAGLNTITLDLKELASGSYIVKLSNSKALITTTVLKF